MPDQSLRTIHTTDRETFKKCRLRWFFSSPLRLGYRPSRAASYLTFGSAGHAALQTYYDSRCSIEAAKRTFQDYYRRWFQDIPSPSPEDEDEYVEAVNLGTNVLAHYGKWAPTVDDFEVVWTERTFHFPINVDHQRTLYSATPDALVRDPHGRLWVMEHKFYEKLPSYGDDDWLMMDEQVGAYIWTIAENTGEWPEGVIYNIVRKKAPAKLAVLKSGHLSTDKRVDTTYDYAKEQLERAYDGMVPGRYVELLEHLQAKGNRFFFRQTVRRTRTEITQLANHIRVEATEMLNRDLPIYRNPNRFNCSTCPYVGPCVAYYEDSDYQTMLEGNYVHVS